MKVLILGDGILGRELSNQTGWDIISRKKDGFDITQFHTNKMKLLGNELGVVWYKKYDVIVNCMANTDTYTNDFKSLLEVNYDGVINLVKFCNEWKMKLVQISTEFVYNNHNGLPKEDDILYLNCNNFYIYSKILADQYIIKHQNGYLICRCLHKDNNFNPDAVWDVQTSGDLVLRIAPLIIKLIDNEAFGVYNVGTGDKHLSTLSINSPIIPPPKGVPTDTRMDLTKLNKFLDGL